MPGYITIPPRATTPEIGMAWSAFDTHKAVGMLCGAGFDDAHARASTMRTNVDEPVWEGRCAPKR